jgi:hypothetical protein
MNLLILGYMFTGTNIQIVAVFWVNFLGEMYAIFSGHAGFYP